jgi:diadenosine tetraphosphatase ApaH/serine/threonine PP2A family protein phosphatase
LRIAIISDIHGNVEALETALSHIKSNAVDSIYCLGDIVGYGANPAECIDIVQDITSGVVLGNHDEAVFKSGAEDHFSQFAAQAVQWTRSKLSDTHIAFLKSLPLRISIHDMLMVHSAPGSPEAWKYIFNSMDAASQKDNFTERLCFIGHSHIPGCYSLTRNETQYSSQGRFIINVGSIGQPRDADPRLSYGLVDTFVGSYENVRLEYDVQRASDKIKKSGLPGYLADRILQGR